VYDQNLTTRQVRPCNAWEQPLRPEALARGFQTLKPRRWPEEGPRWPGFWGWPGLHISDITNDVMKSVNSRSKAEATRRQWTTVRRLVIDQEQTKNQVGSGFTSNFKLRVTKTLTMSLSRYVTRTVTFHPVCSMAETRAAPSSRDVLRTYKQEHQASRRGTTRVLGRVQTKQGEKFFVSGMNDVNGEQSSHPILPRCCQVSTRI